MVSQGDGSSLECSLNCFFSVSDFLRIMRSTPPPNSDDVHAVVNQGLADMKSHCHKKAAELWFVAQLCQTV